MTPRTNAKKIWLVNRDFQLRYTGAGLAAGIVSTLITATLILYPLFQFKIITVGFFLPWPIFACIFAAAALNAGVQVAFGIVMTHKVAGPMFSLIKYLRLIEVGKWNVTMKQRPGDDLQIIVRHVNEMSEGLVARVTCDLKQLEEIKDRILASTGELGERDLIVAGIERLIAKMAARIESK
jgi:hypothetical protein